jgi:hypothetical protein
MIESTIPFPGFYESILSGELDSVEDMEIENMMEDKWDGLEAEQIRDVLVSNMDYKGACADLAEAYVSRFEDWLNEELDLDIHLDFSTMYSPREYNFTTDRVFVNISRSDLAKLYRRVGRQVVRDEAKKHFTSRSGFISFYSSDISDWGPIREWDYNQIGMIFEAAAHVIDQYRDEDLAIYYRMSEDFYQAYSGNVDWGAVERDLQHLVDVENGEAEMDARQFPPDTITEMGAYIKKFEELNQLKGA